MIDEQYLLCIKKTCITWVAPVFAVWIGYFGLVREIVVVQNLAIALTVIVFIVAFLFLYERTKLTG